MKDTLTRYFSGNNEQAIILEKQQNITENFNFNNNSFYVLNAMHFVSPQILDDDDLDEEYADANNKVNKIAQFFLQNGLNEISSKEYKENEKQFKENKQKPFLDSFSAEERFVYDKIKTFINEFDFEVTNQKSFLTSLRSVIIKDEPISVYSLEAQAERTKKNLDDIFDVGQQSLIVDFATKLQQEVKNNKNIKQKMKI